MFNFLKRKDKSIKTPCKGGCPIGNYFPRDQWNFTRFHRGGDGEMYVIAHFVCNKCGCKNGVSVRLPQDFTDRCDETYPFPWFPHPEKEKTEKA
jgi:hypothetical protein